MPDDPYSALIAAAVAFLTSGITGVVTWLKLRREARKWAVDLRSQVELEHVKTRLVHFGKVSEIIGQLSSRAQSALTPTEARQVGMEINDWFYSLGGLVADKSTRGAILGLRDACLRWNGSGVPDNIWTWRDLALFYLRRDLHLTGLDQFDATDTASSLARLTREMEAISG